MTSKQHFLDFMRTALDEIEQTAPADLAFFHYADLLTAQAAEPASNRDIFDAAAEGDVHTTRFFSRQPTVDMNAGDIKGATPMYYAVVNGHAEVVTVLLDAGATTQDIIDGLVMDGMHGLHLEEPVRFTGIDGISPFLAAAREGQFKVLTAILDHGGVDIDINHGTGTNYMDDFGNTVGATAMFLAAKGGHVEAMKVLLDHGACIHQCTEHGWSPMCVAANGGHVGAIKLLINSGANLNGVAEFGGAPIHIASKAGHAEVARVLLKAGANARGPTMENDFALHLAAKHGHLDTVRVLAEVWPTNPLAWRMFLMGGGAASELRDYLAPPTNRETRNHLPRLYGKPDMMKEVYKYLHKPRYVDLDQTDGQGMTALECSEHLNEQLRYYSDLSIEVPPALIDYEGQTLEGVGTMLTLLRELSLG